MASFVVVLNSVLDEVAECLLHERLIGSCAHRCIGDAVVEFYAMLSRKRSMASDHLIDNLAKIDVLLVDVQDSTFKTRDGIEVADQRGQVMRL